MIARSALGLARTRLVANAGVPAAVAAMAATGANFALSCRFAACPARGLASQAPQGHPGGQNRTPPKKSKLPLVLLLAAVAAGGYAYAKNQHPDVLREAEKRIGLVPQVDYRKVAEDIAEILDADDYDDGSYGPLLIRLAWHASGTYSKHDQTGGSNGATMRHATEAGDGANNGLHIARDLLEKIKAKHPGISYADLWTLAGVVAVKELGGPSIPWKPGRTDEPNEKECPPVGRLPDASKNHQHVRDVFYRMGFDDREIVALIGAHALGRCHTDRSGYEGPWTFSPTYLTNEFYKLLLNETWVKRDWSGPHQYQDKKTRSLMMLPTDMELIWDKDFKKYTVEFANDEKAFFSAFSSAFKKLLELGVQFPAGTQEITLE